MYQLQARNGGHMKKIRNLCMIRKVSIFSFSMVYHVDVWVVHSSLLGIFYSVPCGPKANQLFHHFSKKKKREISFAISSILQFLDEWSFHLLYTVVQFNNSSFRLLPSVRTGTINWIAENNRIDRNKRIKKIWIRNLLYKLLNRYMLDDYNEPFSYTSCRLDKWN